MKEILMLLAILSSSAVTAYTTSSLMTLPKKKVPTEESVRCDVALQENTYLKTQLETAEKQYFQEVVKNSKKGKK